MMVLLVRAARWFGWIVFIGSVGTVLVALIGQVALGPVAGQSFWPSPRLWRYFFTSLGIASGATFVAAGIAFFTSMALVTSRHRWQRAIIAALAILPIVSMPSEHGYAWFLMATSRNSVIAAVFKFIHWNTPGAMPIHAAWALATWLWPIPCLIVGASFRHVGAAAYQLASLDAPKIRAFGAAISVMRGPIAAALAAVFCLSLIDSTIPPLVGMNQSWSVEMMAQAAAAPKYSRPTAFLFFQAWPMLAIVGLLALAAAPGIRQMSRWSDAPESNDLGSSRAAAWWPGAFIAFAVSLFPFVIFCVELSTGRTTAGQAMSTAIRTLWRSGAASLLVAALSGIGATCLSIALMDEGESGRGFVGLVRRISFCLLLVVAVLPPELSGTALVSAYSRLAGPLDWWSLYDRTPWPWSMGMVIRFGFVSACVGR
jgi:ABC-type Fe3+ transport system permease subunit